MYTFVIWIIRGAYDVVVDLILLDALEESYIERSIIGALLRVDDDFRLGTYLTTGLACGLQILGEIVPVGVLIS